MRFMIRTAAVVAGMALAAVPAYGAAGPPSSTPPGYDGSTNPGTQHQPASIPPQQANTNGGAANTNAGNTSQPSSPHALAVQQCASFKTNFKVNKNAFGKCVAAVQQSLISNTSPTQACKSERLSRTRHDKQARSDFKACVLAATKAQRAQNP